MLSFIITVLCIGLLLLQRSRINSLFTPSIVLTKTILPKIPAPPQKHPHPSPTVPAVYLGQPTKCFSCEQQLTRKQKYLGGPTKCFSCEKDLINRYGHPNGSFGQATKCFSCEKQMSARPF